MSSLPEVPKRAARRARTEKAKARITMAQSVNPSSRKPLAQDEDEALATWLRNAQFTDVSHLLNKEA